MEKKRINSWSERKEEKGNLGEYLSSLWLKKALPKFKAMKKITKENINRFKYEKCIYYNSQETKIDEKPTEISIKTKHYNPIDRWTINTNGKFNKNSKNK